MDGGALLGSGRCYMVEKDPGGEATGVPHRWGENWTKEEPLDSQPGGKKMQCSILQSFTLSPGDAGAGSVLAVSPASCSPLQVLGGHTPRKDFQGVGAQVSLCGDS